jgi:predicted site-specific integrase-resolvase
MHTAKAFDIDDTLKTDADLMRMLGVTRVTLWSWRKSGRLPYRKIGAKIRYTTEDIRALLARCSRGGGDFK